MPLRALVDGRAVQVWDLTRAQWAGLRRLGREQATSSPVLMACCGRPGLAKTSRKGNPFFAHRTGPGHCPSAPPGSFGPEPACCWAGESSAHAACKLLAAAGARAAGWQVETEASAPDGRSWRADLLCSRGRARVAIEVQLAPIALGQMRLRQERYREAGVRGAWLVPAGRCPAPSRSLPAFPLIEGGTGVELSLASSSSSDRYDHHPAVVVWPDGAIPLPPLPLDVFVRHLLQGQICLAEQRVERPLPCPVLVTAPDACRRCGEPFRHIAGVTNLATPALPRYRLPGEVPLVALCDLWQADRYRA